MTAEDYQKIKQIFQSATEISKAERNSFLEANCADENLRKEVEKLLSAYDDAEDFIETAATIFSDFSPAEERKFPEKIGNYKVLRELGRGGMGAVFLAERDDAQFKKQVAIKFIRRDFEGTDGFRRFREERQILAALEHPNIARLLDGGETENGSPYLVMEYIDGVSLKEFCTERRSSLEERLNLFLKICEAVQYAHQNLVIHRDLKPSNILVTKTGEPKLLDFGVAKLLNPEFVDSTETTPTSRLMTPEYASPEQMRGEKVTTTSDVYSLGVILYELLTGERPFNLTNKTFAEILQTVENQEPSRPSKIRKANSEIKSLQTELDDITLKALRKERENRYQSAAEFAADIRRYLNGFPVSASTGNFAYYAKKFIKRNRLAVGAASLVLLAIISGIAATVWQARIAQNQAKIAAEERDKAQTAQAKAEAINNFLQKMLSSAAPKNAGREVKIVEVLANAETQAKEELADNPAVLAAVLGTIGNTYSNLAQLADAERVLRVALGIYANLPEKNEQISKSEVLGELSDVLLVQNRTSEAEPLAREAVEIQRRFQPETNRKLAISLIQLGRGLLQKGDLEQSEPLFNEGFNLARETEGEKSEVAMFALNQLGVIAERRGDLKRYEEIYRQIIPVLRENPAAKSNLATSLANLGDTLTELGKLDEAEKLIAEGLMMHREHYGEENIYVAGATGKLARLRLTQNRFQEAAAEAQKSLALIEKLLPKDAPLSVVPLTVLGEARGKLGKANDCRTFLQKALEISEKTKNSEWRKNALREKLQNCGN